MADKFVPYSGSNPLNPIKNGEGHAKVFQEYRRQIDTQIKKNPGNPVTVEDEKKRQEEILQARSRVIEESLALERRGAEISRAIGEKKTAVARAGVREIFRYLETYRKADLISEEQYNTHIAQLRKDLMEAETLEFREVQKGIIQDLQNTVEQYDVYYSTLREMVGQKLLSEEEAEAEIEKTTEKGMSARREVQVAAYRAAADDATKRKDLMEDMSTDIKSGSEKERRTTADTYKLAGRAATARYMEENSAMQKRKAAVTNVLLAEGKISKQMTEEDKARVNKYMQERFGSDIKRLASFKKYSEEEKKIGTSGFAALRTSAKVAGAEVGSVISRAFDVGKIIPFFQGLLGNLGTAIKGFSLWGTAAAILVEGLDRQKRIGGYAMYTMAAATTVAVKGWEAYNKGTALGAQMMHEFDKGITGGKSALGAIAATAALGVEAYDKFGKAAVEAYKKTLFGGEKFMAVTFQTIPKLYALGSAMEFSGERGVEFLTETYRHLRIEVQNIPVLYTQVFLASQKAGVGFTVMRQELEKQYDSLFEAGTGAENFLGIYSRFLKISGQFKIPEAIAVERGTELLKGVLAMPFTQRLAYTMVGMGMQPEQAYKAWWEAIQAPSKITQVPAGTTGLMLGLQSLQGTLEKVGAPVTAGAPMTLQQALIAQNILGIQKMDTFIALQDVISGFLQDIKSGTNLDVASVAEVQKTITGYEDAGYALMLSQKSLLETLVDLAQEAVQMLMNLTTGGIGRWFFGGSALPEQQAAATQGEAVAQQNTIIGISPGDTIKGKGRISLQS